MRDFLRVYWKLTVIAVLMILVAAILYMRSYEEPMRTSQKAGEIVGKLDKLYESHASTTDKQQEVMADLLHEEHEQFWNTIKEHLAEALILAAIMILTAEGFTKYMASREEAESQEMIANQFQLQANKVFENVWNAIFNRLVPEPISVEIKRVLKSPVCRMRPTYTVIFSNAGYTDVPAGYVVVRRQMYYGLLNLTGGPVYSPIAIATSSTTVGDTTLTAADGSKVTLPRICEVKINKIAETLRPDQRTSYTKTVHLETMTGENPELCEVYSEVEGLSLLTDRTLYVLTAPCLGIEVQVINNVPDLLEIPEDGVQLTSGQKRLRETTPLKWVCDDGLLSGTALSVPWRAVTKNQAKGAADDAVQKAVGA